MPVEIHWCEATEEKTGKTHFDFGANGQNALHCVLQGNESICSQKLMKRKLIVWCQKGKWHEDFGK